MKLDLSVPAINVICHALQALQQQTAVVLEQIAEQAKRIAELEAENASLKKDAPKKKAR
jgi:cell division protein FtsB